MLFLRVRKQLLNSYNALSTVLGIGDILVITNNYMPGTVRGTLEDDTECHHGIWHEGSSFSGGGLELPQVYDRTL